MKNFLSFLHDEKFFFILQINFDFIEISDD